MASSFSDYPAQDQDAEEISSPSVVQALFHKNRNFEISGGTFNFSVQRKEPDFENFRRIRLGDIVLGEDIGAVQRVHGRTVFRRVYRAKVVGMDSPMTVTTYEGQEKDVNEVWNEYISLHMRLRHPNILQLFGITSSQGLYAAIYHDEYISWEQMKTMYSNTPTRQVYFEHFSGKEFEAHGPYIAFMKNMKNKTHLDMEDCTYWFHRSGKLCIEDTPTLDAQFPSHFVAVADMTIHSPKYILPPVEASEMMDSLDLESYYRELIHLRLWQVQTIPLARHSTIRPHGVVKDVAGDLQEVAYLQLKPTRPTKWDIEWGNIVNPGFIVTDMMPNGWTRVRRTEFVEHPQLQNPIFRLRLYYGTIQAAEEQFAPFAQANYITRHLDLEPSSYSYIGEAYPHYSFTSWLPGSLQEILFFLPPSRGFYTSDLTQCCFTTEEPYWSFDPSGNDRLSPNEALNLGLPQASLEILVSQAFVDEALFKDLHTFHTMKGFNADSQDIAKHLGLPLYYFGDEGDPPPSPLFDVSYDSVALLHEGSDEEKEHKPLDGDLAPRSPFLEDVESDDEQILYPRMAPSI